jgi:hypothetical protein
MRDNMRIKSKLVKGVIGIAALTAFVAVMQEVAVASQTPSPSMDEALRNAYSATDLGAGQPLPAVVGRVGQTDLSGPELARNVAIMRYNNERRHLGLTEQQMRSGALQQLIRQAALHDRARAEGVVVTNAEVYAFIQMQAAKRPASFAAHPDALAAFNAMLAGEGIPDAAAFDRDPRTFRAVQYAIESARLITNHVGKNATEEDREAFVSDTIARANTTVSIVVN